MDRETGVVITGRFADGKDTHDKWYEPRYGCHHELVAGHHGQREVEQAGPGRVHRAA